jgi:hypothetical protein
LIKDGSQIKLSTTKMFSGIVPPIPISRNLKIYVPE